LASDRTEVCPDSAISIGVEAPSSAAFVRPEWRSWCSVYGPPGRLVVCCSNTSAARRYDSRARLVLGSTSTSATEGRALR
jgi:hypothetical protein